MIELPQSVRIREVGPRDGFQNEPEVIATDDKVRLIDALARTGVRRLEVTSFVRADVIAQLADAADVLSRINVPSDVALTVLIPNERGLENALALRDRFQEIDCFLSASETHNRKNVNRSIEESLVGLEAVLARAELGADVELTAHFHNTRGQGLANVLAALEAGCASFESSFGELGGCPVPAGATGNIATEDLVSMLHEMGIETGIDLGRLLEATRMVREVLGRPLGSHTLVAGPVDWHEA